MDHKVLDTLALEELEEVKAHAVELIKEKKEAAKTAEKAEKERADANRAEAAKKNVTEGKVIRFIYKGEEHEGAVEKIGAKTVTINIDGNDRYIKFEKIL